MCRAEPSETGCNKGFKMNKFLKIDLNGNQVDLIPVDAALSLCDGCYGLIDFFEKTWGLAASDSVDLVREFVESLLLQLRSGSLVAVYDIFTASIVEVK